MRTDEELTAERNIQIIASALLEVMNVFRKIEGCENKYIRDIGDMLFNKYNEQLQDIADNGNSIWMTKFATKIFFLRHAIY